MTYTLNYLAGIALAIILSRILMLLAGYIGGRLGIGKIVMGLWQKLIKKSKNLFVNRG